MIYSWPTLLLYCDTQWFLKLFIGSFIKNETNLYIKLGGFFPTEQAVQRFVVIVKTLLKPSF